MADYKGAGRLQCVSVGGGGGSNFNLIHDVVYSYSKYKQVPVM